MLQTFGPQTPRPSPAGQIWSMSPIFLENLEKPFFFQPDFFSSHPMMFLMSKISSEPPESTENVGIILFPYFGFSDPYARPALCPHPHGSPARIRCSFSDPSNARRLDLYGVVGSRPDLFGDVLRSPMMIPDHHARCRVIYHLLRLALEVRSR